MDITNYIESELYIIVPVLYVAGIIFKKSSVVDDRWIPIILGILGIVLASVYKLAAYSPDSAGDVLSLLYAGITQGILCAAGSVYANNIVKQIKKDDGDEGNNKSDSNVG